jgi:nucleotide-binding universal stress UspA family protein
MLAEEPGLIMAGADVSHLSVGGPPWATRLARMTGAQVHVLIGIHIPMTIFTAPPYIDAEYARDAQAVLDFTIEEAFEQEGPAQALAGVTCTDEADMLVVGSHRQGELPGLYLGRSRDTASTTPPTRYSVSAVNRADQPGFVDHIRQSNTRANGRLMAMSDTSSPAGHYANYEETHTNGT